ncbi:hypothetical protein NPIL_411451 [Nephila pilipes]|uniref:Uncharacterized protein n=1 Tax=Nephila pilipes TaxID=299642 RepID=A0A8X6MGF1_NEPPI|nr:hypothetical protein NPIL_411451 [Nephila pilipes]
MIHYERIVISKNNKAKFFFKNYGDYKVTDVHLQVNSKKERKKNGFINIPFQAIHLIQSVESRTLFFGCARTAQKKKPEALNYRCRHCSRSMCFALSAD